MNSQNKDVECADTESSEKPINLDFMPFENNISPQFLQQLYEITKKTIVMSDQAVQTNDLIEPNEELETEKSKSENESIIQEQDAYYQTIIDIFLFFKRRFSIPSILNIIHQSAGDVPAAIQRLNHSTSKGEEPCNFSYHKILGTKEQIDAYFTF